LPTASHIWSSHFSRKNAALLQNCAWFASADIISDSFFPEGGNDKHGENNKI
jgi:hypothetical protein